MIIGNDDDSDDDDSGGSPGDSGLREAAAVSARRLQGVAGGQPTTAPPPPPPPGNPDPSSQPTVYLAPEAQRPDLTAPRAGPPRVRRVVLKEHPPLAIAPQKTAAMTAQRTVRER